MFKNRFQAINKLKLPYKVHANFACSFSTDRKISILSERGVYILEMCFWTWPRNVARDMLLKKKFCAPCRYSISENVGLDINDFIDHLPQFQLYEAVLTSDISSNLRPTVPADQQPVRAEWSASEVDGCVPSVLAVLTNLGVVELFWRKVDYYGAESYLNVANLTQLYVDVLSSEWKDCYDRVSVENRYKELVRRVEQVKPTAFTWGHMQEEDGVFWSAFCMAHLDGGVSVWKLKHCEYVKAASESFPIVYFCGRFVTSLRNVTAVYWIPANENGAIIIGNTEGKVAFVSISNVFTKPEFTEQLMYSTVDDITIELIEIVNTDDFRFLLVVKGTALIVCVIDERSQMVGQTVHEIGNIKITGLEHYEGNLVIVSTYTGIVQLLELTYVDAKLRINSVCLDLGLKWRKYRTHGLIVSKNRVFMGLLVHPCTQKHWEKRTHFTKLVIFRDKRQKPIKLLLKNKTGCLSNFWDCFEVLRMHGFLKKVYPCRNYPFVPKLNPDLLNLTQLKSLLHLSRLTELIAKIKKIDVKRNIEPSVVYKKIIQIKMAVQRMSHLLQLREEGHALTDFQFNSLELAVHYLRTAICSNAITECGLGEKTLEELYQLMTIANGLEYPPMARCYWCRDTLIGLVCEPPHQDTRCHISFMQIIGIPGYKCQFCNSLVHPQISEEITHITCPYCDIPMDRYEFFEDGTTAPQNPTADDSVQLFTDKCLPSCLREAQDLRDVPCETVEWKFDPDLVCKGAPNWAEMSVSDVSDEDSDSEDVVKIFERELLGLGGNSDQEMRELMPNAAEYVQE